MHCSASWLCSPSMPAAAVRTQYCVLGFRYLKVHGASSLLHLQGTWKQRGRVAKAAGGGVCALLLSPVQPRHPSHPMVWSTDPPSLLPSNSSACFFTPGVQVPEHLVKCLLHAFI